MLSPADTIGMEAIRMSQDPNSAVDGELEEDGQVTPPSEDEGTGGAEESYSDKVGRSLLADLGVTDEEPTAETPEPAEATEATGDEDETPPPAAQETPEEAMDRWLQKVAANPKSISEIPAKHHPQLFDRAIAAERALQQRAAEMAYTQGLRDGTTQAQNEAAIQASIAEIDDLKKTNVDAYVEWRDEFPDKAAAYDQAKRAKATPGDPSAPSPAAAIAVAAQPLVNRLAEYPDARARIEAKSKANPNLYLMTPQGLAELSADVAEEIAADRLAQAKPQDEPAQRAVEARQQAAAVRKTIPRADVSNGRGGTGEAPLTDNVNELLGMGLRDLMKQEGKAAVRVR